jgi:hypothetical protein
MTPVRLFVSYSHVNKAWFQMLRPLLKFRDVNLVHVWHDQELAKGTPWDETIRDQLEEMDVFLCLVSHHFYASDYIMDVELNEAQRRHQDRDIEVVPILLEPMNLERDIPFLHGLNPIPEFGRPWNSFNPRGNAHQLIRDGVFQAIETVKAKRRAGTP